MRKLGRTLLTQLLLSLLPIAVLQCPDAYGVEWGHPWIEPQDSASAVKAPDEYSWQLFVALNWPADPSTRSADTTKKLGDDGAVVWETWRNARDVFLPKGQDPGAWLSGTRPDRPAGLDRFDPLPIQQRLRLQQMGEPARPTFDNVTSPTQGNETRMNKEAFEFIRANELYNIEGQLTIYDSGGEISFPAAAKEVKAQWRSITSAEKSRYHTVEVRNPDGTVNLFGLTALHVTTKDLPNWLWATFEHVDNPKRKDNERWMLNSSDAFACRGKARNCNEAPKGIGLEGTKWANYRLRGSQTDFVDAQGNPTLLANSEPERGFQLSSSCITCHARASIGRVGGRVASLSIFDRSFDALIPSIPPAPRRGFVGTPKSEWFHSETDTGKQRIYLQTDFVWSLSRANSKTGK